MFSKWRDRLGGSKHKLVGMSWEKGWSSVPARKRLQSGGYAWVTGGDSLDGEGSNNGPMAMLFLERKNACGSCKCCVRAHVYDSGA